MTRQELWTFCLEAKTLIERSPSDVIILPEIYQVVDAIGYAPLGFNEKYVNSLISLIPSTYKQQYEAYGLHFENAT